MSEYEYPFVACKHHKGPQRSYMICNHIVLQHATPVSLERCTDDTMGVILCDREHNAEIVEDFKLVCEGCAIEHGFIPSGAEN